MPEYSKLAPYRLKNTMLGINSSWCIDKTTIELIKESEPAIQEYEDKWAQVDIKNIVQDYVKEEVKDVYSIPLFTEEFCTMMNKRRMSSEPHSRRGSADVAAHEGKKYQVSS